MQTYINVLLVDDDEDDYLITLDALEDVVGRHYRLEWCANYAEGLKVVAESRHDVYLFDYHIGAHTGLELLQEAVTLVDAPIIMLTGMSDPEVDSQAIKLGAADYLVKGQVSGNVLDRAIRHAFERQRMQRALALSEERYAIAAKGANDGLWDWRLDTGEVYFSARWKNMLGYSETEIGNSLAEWLGRIHPDDRLRVEEDIDLHSAGATAKLELEYRMRGKDGHYRWMLTRGLAVRNKQGQVTRMTGWQTDLSERRASYDALTSLPNRTLFFDRLSRAAARKARQPSYSYAVLFLDLDSFKVVNDSLGHAAGDELLLEAATRLERCLRASDTVSRVAENTNLNAVNSTVARFGGDEFALLVDNLPDVDAVTRIAERIQAALARPFSINGQTLFTSASIGIAMGGAATAPEDILRDADIAMYRAKGSGKAQYALFDTDMHDYVRERLELETDLRRALECGEFQLVYQPVVTLVNEKIVGFEALVRWRHPTRGLVLPDAFIPMCEETGLIVLLGEWILREACAQLTRWHASFPQLADLTMSVNLSGKQLVHPDLLGYVKDALADAGLAAHHLRLEVTESMMLDSSLSATNVLACFRELGIKVQIDDFGTGYSSLSRLHTLPLDTLKIDRSFTMRLTQERESAGIIEAIITLARTLGLGVIAEGIESCDQASQLRTLRCDYGQGYLFSPPQEARAVEELLKQAAAQRNVAA